jgi:ABC-type transport system involved in multi-copper enzyme maturation permease subunit
MTWTIYRRELRSRQRKLRALLGPIIYAFILSAGLILSVLIITQTYEQGVSGILERGVGRILFSILAYLQMAVVVLVAPAFTAGVIVGERSEKTLELLSMTLLRPASVLLQKFTSALSSFLVFLSVGLPVVALCYTLGGVSLLDIGFYYALVIVTILSFGAIGLLFSVITRKAYLSFVLTYMVVAYLTVGCFLVGGLVAFLTGLIMRWAIHAELVFGIFVFASPILPLVQMDTPTGWWEWEIPAFFIAHSVLIVLCWVLAFLFLKQAHRFR